MQYEKILSDVMRTSRDMWDKGWAERNAGNISIRLRPAEMNLSRLAGDWQALEAALPGLAGEFFLVSGTGRYLRNIEIAPAKNLGIIELDAAGARYRFRWGFEGDGRPTSELPAHLRVHAVRKKVSNDVDRVVIHTHAPHLIALTLTNDWNDATLTRRLWEVHAECMVVFPEGVSFLPWMMAGSQDIALASAQGFEKHGLVVWQYHGVMGCGRNLDTAFGLIDTAEKAAQLHLLALAAGGVRRKLGREQLVAIAKNFGVTPNPAALAVD